MKRFLVFYGDDYYPGGGFDDYIGQFDTLKECKSCILDKVFDGWDEFQESCYDSKQEYLEYQWNYHWAHIYDTLKQKIIWEKV